MTEKTKKRAESIRRELPISKKMDALGRLADDSGNVMYLVLHTMLTNTLEAIAATIPDLVTENEMTTFNMPREELLPHLGRGVALICETDSQGDYEAIEPSDVAGLIKASLELLNGEPDLAQEKYMNYEGTDLETFIMTLESHDRETWLSLHR